MASDLCSLMTVDAVSPRLASDAPALGLEMLREGVGRILFPLVLPGKGWRRWPCRQRVGWRGI